MKNIIGNLGEKLKRVAIMNYTMALKDLEEPQNVIEAVKALEQCSYTEVLSVAPLISNYVLSSMIQKNVSDYKKGQKDPKSEDVRNLEKYLS